MYFSLDMVVRLPQFAAVRYNTTTVEEYRFTALE